MKRYIIYLYGIYFNMAFPVIRFDFMDTQKDNGSLLRELELLKQENELLNNQLESLRRIADINARSTELRSRYEMESMRFRLLADTNGKKADIAVQSLEMLKKLLIENGNSVSFRIAKMLQIIKNPQILGTDSRFLALCKILSAKLSGKELCPGYTATSSAIGIINDANYSMDICCMNCEDRSPDEPVDESKLISVILPVYNQSDLIHESIESVIAQTYRNWELIIVNDGSTDGLEEAVKPYLSDKRIRCLTQKNQRLPKALSNGFDFASGELITWTSADNNMRPAMLARLASFLNNHPDVDMVYADYMVIDDRGKPFTAEWFRPQNKYVANSPYIHLPRTTDCLNIVQDNFIGASFMYRRNTLKLIGDYDPQLGVEDYDYWMRINSMLKISHLGTNEILYDYRVHDNTLNARAAEFKIHEKVARLMQYDKERTIFYFMPFSIYGSFDAAHSFCGNFKADFCGKHPETLASFRNGRKKLLLIRGSEITDYTDEELNSFDAAALYFDHGEANDAGKYAYFIRKYKLLVLADSNSKEAQMLGMFTSNVVECKENMAAYALMVYANNKLFLNSTRSSAELARELPLPLQGACKKFIILLDKLGTGGMEQVAYDMAAEFSAKGCETLLVSVNGKDDNVCVPAGINFRTLGSDDKAGEFKQLLDGCDAVISHYCTWGADIAYNANVPFYHVLHNTYCWFEQSRIDEFRQADRYTTGYIAVSATVAWYDCECLGLPAEKICIIENGVDFKNYTPSQESRSALRREFGFSGENFVLLNPATIYAVKGQLLLVKAFARAYESNRNLRLIISGFELEAEYTAQIKQFISENSLDEVVRLTGFVSNISDFYNACDAVVLPSFWEGCSLAVAEAVHMKKLIISTKVGDIERQTEYRNSLLIDLPFKYLTDLRIHNVWQELYAPNETLVAALTDALLKAPEYERCEENSVSAEQSSKEICARYLALLNYGRGGLPICSIRHRI